ncbi:GMC family oxidoreductase N-terminal domain-containing protein [Massilia sp. Se16.2.3]|uniref:GMC family oxidoreductase N-terminal domain-containing protein n=1 Tax=Massilia sp. Se16.2.3 TaxID=2709303 RepID=UPI0016002360|nr:GMC family oxidoreductase N-terminal domain-containing protein [Massilia sp. Se16.2.3]QNB00630.1 hypothetical protein G4G31_20460 [Massilia sp. Se16.2.3]
MAARLATGRRLCVLERGKEWAPGDFAVGLADTLAQFRSSAKPDGLFDYRIGATVDVLSGNGIGGTSLINCGVVLAPDRDVFNRWPQAIQNRLRQRRDGRLRDTGTHHAGRRQRRRGRCPAQELVSPLERQGTPAPGIAVTPRAMPIAVNLRRYRDAPNAQGVWQAACTGCGDCVTGCRVGAKNTLDVNYLPLARSAGAEIFSRMEVDWIERLPDGRWRLHVLYRADGGATVQRR